MIHKHNAFILKRFNWRETSLIATFFTDGFGKLEGILKAARVTPQRFSSTFDIFSYNEIIYYKKRKGLHLVVECHLKENYPNIRKDLKADLTAKYFMELTSSMLPPEEDNPEIFSLVVNALSALEQNTQDYERLARLFELHLLSICGFKPHIESCINCQREQLETARFSLHLGGLICHRCFSEDKSAKNILKGTTASMIYIQNNNWPLSLKLNLNEKINSELKFILENFLRFHLEKRLKTSKILSHLQRR